MWRSIDAPAATRLSGLLTSIGSEANAVCGALAIHLTAAGRDPSLAAWLRADADWWFTEAAELRRRTGSLAPAPLSTWSAPPSPRSPAVARYLTDLQLERRELARRAELFHRFTDWLPSPDLRRMAAGLDEQVEHLDVLIAHAEAWGTVLAFDAAGDGRIVEVFGDLDRADHVAVVVPGVGAGLATYDERLRRDALDLFSAIDRTDTAVVAWLDYDAPDAVPLALDEGPAIEASRRLTPFVSDLSGDRHVTVIGHSYGSLVVGLAAREGLKADDVVLLGSPGTGADDRRDLPVMRVWSATAPLDPIRLARDPASLSDPLRGGLLFGTDPSAPEFGARPIDAGNPPAWRAHSSYFSEPTLSELGRIVTGEA